MGFGHDFKYWNYDFIDIKNFTLHVGLVPVAVHV